MSPIQVITVLLPLITLATTQYRYYQTVDQAAAEAKLLEINAACNLPPNPNTFCMGAKDKDMTSFAGDGCLKDTNCEALIYASKLSADPAKKDMITWYFVVPNAGWDVKFFLAKAHNDGKVPPNTVYHAGNPKLQYITDDPAKNKDLDVDTAYSQTSTNMQPAGKIIYTFTSKNVIEYAAIGYKVDADQDELFPVILKAPRDPPNSASTAHQPAKAMKLFTTPTGPVLPPTDDKKTTMPPSAKPSSASRLAIEQIAGLIALAATVALLKFLM